MVFGIYGQRLIVVGCPQRMLTSSCLTSRAFWNICIHMYADNTSDTGSTVAVINI